MLNAQSVHNGYGDSARVPVGVPVGFDCSGAQLGSWSALHALWMGLLLRSILYVH